MSTHNQTTLSVPAAIAALATARQWYREERAAHLALEKATGTWIEHNDELSAAGLLVDEAAKAYWRALAAA